jgi:hypothetical protein
LLASPITLLQNNLRIFPISYHPSSNPQISTTLIMHDCTVKLHNCCKILT